MGQKRKFSSTSPSVSGESSTRSLLFQNMSQISQSNSSSMTHVLFKLLLLLCWDLEQVNLYVSP